MNMYPFIRPGSYYKAMIIEYDDLDKYKWLDKYFPIEKN